ncbi:MAG: hypothetical protein ABIZ80_09450 [Bryobacteraceae bacterium]
MTSILIRLFDGTRKLAEGPETLIRVLDGRKRQLIAHFATKAQVRVQPLTATNGVDDFYTVLASANGFEDSGIFPVRILDGQQVEADLMLLPKEGTFHFSSLEKIAENQPLLARMLTNGVDAAKAKERYASQMEGEQSRLALGALLTIASAIEQIPLAEADRPFPLSYYWELEWDLLMPDRFWAWVEPGLAGAISRMAALNSFEAQTKPARFHPGIPGIIGPATRSWKQTRFDVANVQLTFHENDRKTIRIPDAAGTERDVECVMVEPDIDYFKDMLAHGLLEVIPNLLTNGDTDSRQTYMLRWMAARKEKLADFNPPCTVEA